MGKDLECIICKRYDKVKAYLSIEENADFRYFICTRCQLVFQKSAKDTDSYETFEDLKRSFLHGEISKEEISENYHRIFRENIDVNDSYTGDYDDYTQVAHYLIAKINQICRLDDQKEWKILEVGGADGLLLSKIRKINPKIHTYLIEPSPIMVEKAIERRLDKNCVFCGTLDKAHLRADTYDIVLMFGNLMLHKNPVETLTEIRRVLRSDGILIFDVKNNNTILRWISRKIIRHKWLFRFFGHYAFKAYKGPRYFFTFKSVRKALEKASLYPVMLETVHPRSFLFPNRKYSLHEKMPMRIVSCIDGLFGTRSWIYVVSRKSQTGSAVVD